MLAVILLFTLHFVLGTISSAFLFYVTRFCIMACKPSSAVIKWLYIILFSFSALLIIGWVLKFNMDNVADYDFRHGKYITLSSAFSYLFLLVSFPLFKARNRQLVVAIIILTIGYLLLFYQMGELVGIGQE